MASFELIQADEIINIPDVAQILMNEVDWVEDGPDNSYCASARQGQVSGNQFPRYAHPTSALSALLPELVYCLLFTIDIDIFLAIFCLRIARNLSMSI